MEVNPIVSNFEATVEKLVYGGDGLARLEGRVVFAPSVLPGERIRVVTWREQKGLVRAHTLEVLEPAAERVAAPCPVFGRRAGCHSQHAPYEYQLAAKRAILADQLRRLGKMEPPETIAVAAAETWGYRNRAQLHIDGRRIGYREAGSHSLCEMGHCAIASPAINDAIRALAGMLRDSRWPKSVRSLEIFTDERQVQLNVIDTVQPVAKRFFEWCAEQIPGLVEGVLDYQGRFRVSRHSFFQVNRFLLDRMVEVALEGAQGDTALDLYAGVGLFSVALARRFREVTAVESGSGAVRDLEFNAERADLENLRAEQRMAEEYLQKLERAPDFVLLDPPRAGLGKEMVRRLAELRPRQVTIVSCDPATLARDLAGLTAAGYRVEQMTLVDLFPQTFHLETVVRLGPSC